MGVCLLTVHRVFPKGIPTLTAYAEKEGIGLDSIRRAARALLFPVMRLLKARRPGPKRPASKEGTLASKVLAACQAANAILKALLPGPVESLLATPAKRGMALQVALEFKKQGVPLDQTAEFLDVHPRTLTRWRGKASEDGSGLLVVHKSRRPKSSPRQLPLEIQDALYRMRRGFQDLSVAELTRTFNGCFPKLLKKHGWDPLTAKTAGRYLNRGRPTTPPSFSPQRSERGEYHYPPALTMAWVDTTHLIVVGTEVHIVGAMEAGGRLALAADVFAEENTDATAEILALSLSRIPDLSGVVRDRGTPYLNGRINELLASFGTVPINAYPHFPIDKAALERWWDTVKEWLRHALIPFEEACRKEGRTPSKQEVVTVVRPALRVILRTYNLLPQPCIDGQSPIGRIEALLRGEGEKGFSLSDLRRMAVERETKDDLLVEIRDALQVSRTLEKMRSDFALISKTAIRRAITACAQRLVLDRNPDIHFPYRYLLAVARNKEREWQEEEARRRKEVEEAQRRREEESRRNETLKRDEEERRLHPEERLLHDLESWIQYFRHPLQAMGRRAARRLKETLESLRTKLGEAFAAQLAATQSILPKLLDQLRPGSSHLREALVAELATLALPPAPDTPTHDPMPQPRAGPAPPARASLPQFQRQVRGALEDLFKPHDPRTDVSS